MTIPDYAYTQTVAKQPMSTAEGAGAWVMFINVKSDITVYKQAAVDGQVTLIPEANYTATVVAASPWEFTWTYSGATPPLPLDKIIIFRRVHAIFNDFQPGAFLNADSLNRAFNIETLANNDQGYYQQFSRPGYDDKTLVEKGVFDPPASPGEEEHNPKLAESNYELPYLASSPTATAGDVYVWGYYVDAGPAGPNPRTGEFRDILLHQSGGGTVGQLTQELAAQCPTPGTNIIGVCEANIGAAGWTPGPGMTLTEYFGNLYHRSNTTAENGANLIGFRWSAGVYQGPESVQVALDRLPFIGTAPNYTTTSGAAAIGYGGWALPGGVPGNTVAGCLNRLNEPATSPTASGAAYVQYWNGTASISVQAALNTVEFTHQWVIPSTVGHTEVIPLPPGLLPFARIGVLSLSYQFGGSSGGALSTGTAHNPQDAAWPTFPFGGVGDFVITSATLSGSYSIDFSVPTQITINPTSTVVGARNITLYLQAKPGT